MDAKRLTAYTTAASAAVASASTSQGAILFTNLTDEFGFGADFSTGAFFVDFNDDGIDEVFLSHTSTNAGFAGGGVSGGLLFIADSTNPASFLLDTFGSYIARLEPNSTALPLIDSNAFASRGGGTAGILGSRVLSSSFGSTYRTSYGNFVDTEGYGLRGIVGVTFQLGPLSDPSTHFGWLDVELEPNGLNASIFGFAWETNPGQGIAPGAIPEPAGLALLAGGAGCIAFWRKRRRKTQRDSADNS